MAREEARADLKRNALLPLTSDAVSKKKHSAKSAFLRKSTATKLSQLPFPKKENPGEFAKYGQHLKQEDYIVAGLSAEPVVQVATPKTERKTTMIF